MVAKVKNLTCTKGARASTVNTVTAFCASSHGLFRVGCIKSGRFAGWLGMQDLAKRYGACLQRIETGVGSEVMFIRRNNCGF